MKTTESFTVNSLILHVYVNFISFQTDVFKQEIVDLGDVYKVKIRHDNSMFNPAWYLDWVEVVDTKDNEKYMFHCERWLAKNKDDKKIQRSIYVKVSTNREVILCQDQYRSRSQSMSRPLVLYRSRRQSNYVKLFTLY